jgi:hypothetical protein
MMQLACLLDGGLCILAIVGIPSLLGWMGFKGWNCLKGGCDDHEH